MIPVTVAGKYIERLVPRRHGKLSHIIVKQDLAAFRLHHKSTVTNVRNFYHSPRLLPPIPAPPALHSAKAADFSVTQTLNFFKFSLWLSRKERASQKSAPSLTDPFPDLIIHSRPASSMKTDPAVVLYAGIGSKSSVNRDHHPSNKTCGLIVQQKQQSAV